MAKKNVKIYVEEDGEIYKVSSIYLSSDGSFKVDVPYCRYNRGVVMKFPTSYKDKFIPQSRISKTYFTTRRPQLSIHASGFVQFSGQGIISGIDKVSGEIKGMGLRSQPLMHPIWSGPTFSITCWGFNKGYEKVENIPNGGFVYDKNHFLPMTKGSIDRSVSNSFRLDGWIIPFNERNTEETIYKSEEGEMILIHLPYTPEFLFFPMRIIRLNNIPCVIGLNPSFTHTKLAEDNDFGFSLSSPGEKSKNLKDHWDVMLAIYPDSSDGDFPYLDYQGGS